MNRAEYDFQLRKRAYILARNRGIECVFDPEVEAALRTDKSSLVEVRIDAADPTPRSDADQTMDRVRSNYESAYQKRRNKSTAKPKGRTDAAEPERQALAPSGYRIAGSGYLY